VSWRLDWLPRRLKENVKLVLSISDNELLETLKRELICSNDNYVKVCNSRATLCLIYFTLVVLGGDVNCPNSFWFYELSTLAVLISRPLCNANGIGCGPIL